MENTGWRKTIRSVIPYALGLSSLACAAVIAYFLKEEHEHTNRAYVAGLVSALATFAAAIYARYREIETDKQTQELLALQSENQKLIEKIDANLTGGNSFAVIYFPFHQGKRLLTIRHFGKHPLTNIRISVTAFNPPKVIDAFVYPNLPPGIIENIKPITLDFEKRLLLQIDFKTLSDYWYETIICMRVDEDIIFAIRIWKIEPSTSGIASLITLHEQVHPKFPRDENGLVDWSTGTITISDRQPIRESDEDRLNRQLGVL